MTKERLEWILSGLDRKKLSQLERRFVEQIEKKLPEDLTPLEEDRLENIYRFKGQ